MTILNCTMCDKKLSEFGSVKVHETVHNDYKAFQCTMCDKKFSKFDTVKVHETVHPDDKASLSEMGNPTLNLHYTTLQLM